MNSWNAIGQMETSTFEVEQPGLLTTVQDLGRHGRQHTGMVVAGAMDLLAARVGNILLGNPETCAVLEVTMLGPALRALGDTYVAITGANMNPTIDGLAVNLWTPLLLRVGQVLRFGRAAVGARSYVAAAGGIETPPVLGSRSTYLNGSIGGVSGRALVRGDVLACGKPFRNCASLIGWFAASEICEVYGAEALRRPLRIVDGPLIGDFTNEGLRVLMQSNFVVGLDSDRMGYRLEGPAIEKRPALGEMLSEPVAAGALQVSPNNLMLLMADRQTTGGYPVVGVVCAVDLPRAAQLRPGDIVRFAPVDLSSAHSALIALERSLEIMRWSVRLR